MKIELKSQLTKVSSNSFSHWNLNVMFMYGLSIDIRVWNGFEYTDAKNWFPCRTFVGRNVSVFNMWYKSPLVACCACHFRQRFLRSIQAICNYLPDQCYCFTFIRPVYPLIHPHPSSINGIFWWQYWEDSLSVVCWLIYEKGRQTVKILLKSTFYTWKKWVDFCSHYSNVHLP